MKVKAALDDEDDRASLAEMPNIAEMLSRNPSFVSNSPAPPRKGKLGKLIAEESRSEGAVSAHVFKCYFNAIGGLLVIIPLFVIQFVWQVATIGSDFWLSHWTSESTEQQASEQGYNLTVYAILALGGASMVLARTAVISWNGWNGAKKLFDGMTHALLRAPMAFFDANPLGRILNRYSDDIAAVDFRLPLFFGTLLATGFSTGFTVLTAMYVTRQFGIMFIPLIFLYFKMAQFYLAGARELQRITKVTASPLLSFVSETMDGVYVVRSFGHKNVERFINRNANLIDKQTRTQTASFITQNWFSMRMQLIGALALTIVVIALALLRDTMSPGIIGIAFNYGLMIDTSLNSLVQIWALLEMNMVSPERLQEYIDVKAEADRTLPSDEKLLKPKTEMKNGREVVTEKRSWPSKGAVSIENMSYTYKDGAPLVLKDLSLDIKAGEKIGVVGRTGAGKSSMTMALFRINELSGGKVFIDGVDSSTVGLKTLRSGISIISQTPVLFEGTLRGYLDPFDEFQDSELWEVLRRVEIADKIQTLPGQLMSPMEENGENYSVGERQILCMARSLLTRAPVVVMDEATAAIDHKTDCLLQSVIREDFASSTVITIAHRLDTVMDSDKILVLGAGRILEFESPKTLIASKKGHFYELAKEGGYLDEDQ